MNNKKSLLFLLLTLVLFALVAFFNRQETHAEQTAVTAASNWSEPEVLTDVSNNSVTPVLRRDSTGNMIVVFARGASGNADPVNLTWSNNLWTTNPEPLSDGSAGDSATPDVAYDNNDLAHAIWVNDNNHIYYADENDWGFSVDPLTTTISSNTSESSIAIDSNNKVHAVWQTGLTIYYAHHIGNSWSAPAEIDADTNTTISASFTPVIVIDNNDTIHVAWKSYVSGIERIVYRSTSVGVSFPSSFTPELLSGTVATPQQPILLANGNSIHLSFTEYADTTLAQQIHYIKSTDNGSNWSEPIPIGDTFYANQSGGSTSAMAVCGDTIHLYYYGNTLDGITERIWEVSNNNGIWEDISTPITPQNDNNRAVNPSAACAGGSSYLVYEEIPPDTEYGPSPHTINYMYSSTFIYLPVILK